MRIAVLLLTLTLAPQMAFAQDEATPAPEGVEAIAEDAAPGIPFKEGDVISFETIDKLKDYLPPQFWEHREYFFYEGMEIKIGPVGRDYTPADAYMSMTQRQAGKTTIGPDGALLNYRGGRPFPTEGIDCKGDPQAGNKIAFRCTTRAPPRPSRWRTAASPSTRRRTATSSRTSGA
jgi:hypothetical protein